MDTREWLSRARKIQAEIDALVKMKEQLTFPIGRGEPIKRSIDPHGRMDEIAVLSAKIDEKISSLNLSKGEILTVIEGISDPFLRSLIINHYINGETWEQISDETKYTLRHIARLASTAIRIVEELLPKEVPDK